MPAGNWLWLAIFGAALLVILRPAPKTPEPGATSNGTWVCLDNPPSYLC